MHGDNLGLKWQSKGEKEPASFLVNGYEYETNVEHWQNATSEISSKNQNSSKG